MGRLRTGFASGQLRWVVLLLIVAVILPTVCLLWFMSEVVRNERLAIRQKLVTIYREQLTRTVKQVNDSWSQNYKFLDTQDPNAHPYQVLAAVTRNNFCDGLLIYDSAGTYIYPTISTETGVPSQPSAAFTEAWQLEFVNQEFARAAELYDQITKDSNDLTRLTAFIGKSRCLAKLDMPDQAIEVCRQVAFSPLQKRGDAPTLTIIGNAGLLLLKFTSGSDRYKATFEETIENLVSMLYSANQAGFSLPPTQNLFVAQKVLDAAQAASPTIGAHLQPLLAHLQKLVSAEELSIRIAENIPKTAPIHNRPQDTLQQLPVQGQPMYGLVHTTADRTFLLILSAKRIAQMLGDYKNNLADSYIDYRILDDSGYKIAGADHPESEPVTADSAGRYFPGWRIELYLRGSDVYEKAASERIAVYIWTGILVISLILVSGAFAAKAIVSQVKLNRLKNDFIATVSHELKTPLASMRVLVDTLLEGNYRNQQQALEYLQLISTENIRLSRLIDNFLTFSRMERNKRAFQLVTTDPAQIAHAASDAVKTKFSDGHCKFTVDIQQDLPAVYADYDAMVTVIVNLLDNAYKYSYDDKCIELRVLAENGFVVFRVTDNGIGLSRRLLKKIFKRFYQVDRSLSRRAGGCGLGLSIAKFIVDAHKGKVAVESKTGKGSTFTVRIPIWPKHAD
jgi:signal transduction histidine kinase